MMKGFGKYLIYTGMALLVVLIFSSCGPTVTPIPPPSDTPTAEVSEPEAETAGETAAAGDAVKAVDLLAAWVDAGAPEGESFQYTGIDGNGYEATFEVDVLPLFTENGIWFEGSQACTGCHFDVSENSYHELDLNTHEGILLGADSLSDPDDPEEIITPGDWSASSLRARMRNNRMPP
ncbi:MAG TPA: hypothetical protein VFZ76_06900, partial [Anaerolineales bacterium]